MLSSLLKSQFFYITLPDPISPLLLGIIELHDHILFFLTIILSVVVILLITTVKAFNYNTFSEFNKQCLRIRSSLVSEYTWSRLNHGIWLEIIWTIIPTIILLAIAVPSFALLYGIDELVDPSLTIKVIGHQWYWSYEYADIINYTLQKQYNVSFNNLFQWFYNNNDFFFIKCNTNLTNIKYFIWVHFKIKFWEVEALDELDETTSYTFNTNDEKSEVPEFDQQVGNAEKINQNKFVQEPDDKVLDQPVNEEEGETETDQNKLVPKPVHINEEFVSQVLSFNNIKIKNESEPTIDKKVWLMWIQKLALTTLDGLDGYCETCSFEKNEEEFDQQIDNAEKINKNKLVQEPDDKVLDQPVNEEEGETETDQNKLIPEPVHVNGEFVSQVLSFNNVEIDTIKIKETPLYNLPAIVWKFFFLTVYMERFVAQKCSWLPSVVNSCFSLEKTIHYIATLSVSFDSYMVHVEDLQFGERRLLKTDHPLIVPKNLHIRFLISSEDVIHSWSVPSMGLKVDAVPGRINQLGVFIKQSGVYYGQCSELCGVNHAFMPIEVLVCSPELYYEYLRHDGVITNVSHL